MPDNPIHIRDRWAEDAMFALPDNPRSAWRSSCGRCMARFILKLRNSPQATKSIECVDLGEARNAAVRHLGRYLSDHPGFVDEGHWQLDIENSVGQSLAHIIVATVIPRSSPFRTDLTANEPGLG